MTAQNPRPQGGPQPAPIADYERARLARRAVVAILCEVFADATEVFGSPLGQYLHDVEFYNKVNVAADEIERVRCDDPPPVPLVADPKLMTHLIMSGTPVPPPYPALNDGEACGNGS